MSFDFFSAYATDENLENNGTLFPCGGGFLLVARAGNRKYAKALTKAVETRRVELDGGDDAAAAVSDQIMVDVMAETILLGWTGPVDKDGNATQFQFKGADLPYSLENAKKTLALRDFRKFVAGLSDQMDAYKVKSEKAAGEV